MLLADVNVLGIDADMGLLVTVTGVVVAGFAAVLGIWMERDDSKPPRYAYALSGLILLATLVSVAQSYLDSKETDQIKDDMARLLQRMDQIATVTDNTELSDLVSSELSAQSRANPEVVEKLAQRVSDGGADPNEVLAKHLDLAEVEAVSRRSKVKPRKIIVADAGEAAPAPLRARGVLRRGSDAAHAAVREADPANEAAPAETAAPVEPSDASSLRRGRGAQPESETTDMKEGETAAREAGVEPAVAKAKSLRKKKRRRSSKAKSTERASR